MKKWLITDSQLEVQMGTNCHILWSSYYYNKLALVKDVDDALNITRDLYLAVTADCRVCACVFNWNSVIVNQESKAALIQWLGGGV